MRAIGILILLVAMMLQSCTIEKRHHLKGYHVEWFHRGKDSKIHVDSEITVVEPKDTAHADVTEELSTEEFQKDTLKKSTSSAIQKLLLMDPTSTSIQKKERNTPVSNPLRIRQNLVSLVESGILLNQKKEKTTFQDLDPSATTLAMIGFIFACITLLLFVIAISIAEGWAALGYIAMAIVAGVTTFLFASIAQIIFWNKHQGVPWFQWPGLIISLFALYVVIRIIIDRLR